MLAAPGLGSQGLEHRTVIPTIKALKRMHALQGLRDFAGGLMWLRINLNKPHWASDDCKAVLREARKRGLITGCAGGNYSN